MSKKKKLPVSEFISDKKLGKLEKIVQTSPDVETAYDRIEEVMSDDFITKDLGTNRLIFIHKKDKYKKLIFKVAGDSHGIEANYREFYNGDLDPALTFSYSISDNGVFIVQERVKPMNSKMMEKYKKDVRKMLHHLEDKILLVDCKLSNFKNFGVRKDGEVCLLDHGDTVPLPKYQDSNIVNMDEECNVSLRCKKFKDTTVSEKKLKPCGGKLEYSKNYDYLKCKRCGGIMSVHDAYKEFWGDSRGGSSNSNKDLLSNLDFDPDEWKKTVQSYCIDTMASTKKKSKNIKNEGEDTKMTVKTINGQECRQMKGYWIPEKYLKSSSYAIIVASLKSNRMKPAEFLENLKLNPDDYKVRLEEHTPNKYKAEKKDWEYRLSIPVNKIVEIVNEKSNPKHPERAIYINYKDLNRLVNDEFIVDNYAKERAIYSKLINMKGVTKVVYTKEFFKIMTDGTKLTPIEDIEMPNKNTSDNETSRVHIRRHEEISEDERMAAQEEDSNEEIIKTNRERIKESITSILSGHNITTNDIDDILEGLDDEDEEDAEEETVPEETVEIVEDIEDDTDDEDEDEECVEDESDDEDVDDAIDDIISDDIRMESFSNHLIEFLTDYEEIRISKRYVKKIVPLNDMIDFLRLENLSGIAVDLNSKIHDYDIVCELVKNAKYTEFNRVDFDDENLEYNFYAVKEAEPDIDYSSVLDLLDGTTYTLCNLLGRDWFEKYISDKNDVFLINGLEVTPENVLEVAIVLDDVATMDVEEASKKTSKVFINLREIVKNNIKNYINTCHKKYDDESQFTNSLKEYVYRLIISLIPIMLDSLCTCKEEEVIEFVNDHACGSELFIPIRFDILESDDETSDEPTDRQTTEPVETSSDASSEESNPEDDSDKFVTEIVNGRKILPIKMSSLKDTPILIGTEDGALIMINLSDLLKDKTNLEKDALYRVSSLNIDK